MCRLKYPKIVTLGVIFFGLYSSVVFAVEDGFVATKKNRGKHFTVFYDSSVNVSVLTKQLNISASDRLLAGKAPENSSSPEEELVEMLDILFIRVCDILDMRLYKFEGNIKICQDDECLKRIYLCLFGQKLKQANSFYSYDLNTIYVSVQNFKGSVLGHEIAHAVISHYFVVLPSVKIQEVLAGYVEYQLRKK
jgi:hypothetical protein